MLPKKYRLTRDSKFAQVFKKGKNISGKYFNLSFFASGDTLRIGIIVSNKVSKKAVERNRIKRIARVVMKENLSKIKDGTWLTIVARCGSETVENEILRQDLEIIISKYANNIT